MLGTPPAFILSHDQTLKFVVFICRSSLSLPLLLKSASAFSGGLCVISDASPFLSGLRRVSPFQASAWLAGFSRLPLWQTSACLRVPNFSWLFCFQGAVISNLRNYRFASFFRLLRLALVSACEAFLFLAFAPSREANVIISILRILSTVFFNRFQLRK